MALRIQVDIQMNVNDGSFNIAATYRDTVTGRWNAVGVTIADPGGTTASVRNTLLQAAVDACNRDNTVGGASTTNATVSDIIPNG